MGWTFGDLVRFVDDNRDTIKHDLPIVGTGHYGEVDQELEGFKVERVRAADERGGKVKVLRIEGFCASYQEPD